MRSNFAVEAQVARLDSILERSRFSRPSSWCGFLVARVPCVVLEEPLEEGALQGVLGSLLLAKDKMREDVFENLQTTTRKFHRFYSFVSEWLILSRTAMKREMPTLRHVVHLLRLEDIPP